MKYVVQRALRLEDDVYNIGDSICITLKDKKVYCVLQGITWLNEYEVGLMTDKGTFNISSIIDINPTICL